jgi:hypothetical protein
LASTIFRNSHPNSDELNQKDIVSLRQIADISRSMGSVKNPASSSLLEAPRIAKLCKNKHISSRALSGSVAGLFLSYWWDLPSGAAIVCTFGALLILVSLLAFCRNRFQRLDDTP